MVVSNISTSVIVRMYIHKSRIVRCLRTVVIPRISTKTISRVLTSEVLTMLRSKTSIKPWLLIIMKSMSLLVSRMLSLTMKSGR
ncbi:hypothetical protein HanXRQr2_Chr14g0632401 [Helianthus annuus]|uniref:Uncharacterized protein n=1 Tax=Helianthus annuus TaxID=4232 RepID=A0A251SIX5_HELAN|nr:hypothetical protein HanXRQr2_Chr14g0632401 [Helianthus annuus]KAJ0463433.1 hypothetical protein HanHA300_Chr14g0515621 [Helianthus annuus]KAJ0484897.1 hypothetical protein HanHA89_Chr14g0562001 [Helianthus annuus]KAJ0655447.1 hypothetical protein HanLR1_Chr14g0524321 [Helianthus annuus]KAJ0839417.1 hypothetical protein HanPSC8_Chr14g0606551 [Helianthus annuus]